MSTCLGLLFACKSQVATQPSAPEAAKLKAPEPGSHLLPIVPAQLASLVPSVAGFRVLEPFAFQDGKNFIAAATYCAPSDEAAARSSFDAAMKAAGWKTIEETHEKEKKGLLKYERAPLVLIASIGESPGKCKAPAEREIKLTHLHRDF